MTDAVAYADDFPDPRTSCPSTDSLAGARVAPALVAFGVQALFVVTLLMVGVGLPTATLFVVGVFVIDVLVLTARPSGKAMLLSVLVSALSRAAGMLPSGALRWPASEAR